MNFKLIKKVFPFAVLFVFHSFVYAKSVKFAPVVEVSETYSDNVTLSSKGLEQDDYITQINPGITMKIDGQRLKANLDYTMQNLFYAKDNKRNITFHKLNAGLDSELIEDNIFLKMGASRSRQVISESKSSNTGDIALNKNLSEVDIININPYWEHRFKSIMDAKVSYSYSDINYLDSVVGDSTYKIFQTKFSSPADMRGFAWELEYNSSKQKTVFSSDVKLSRSSLLLGYRFSPRTMLFVTGGEDDNSYATSSPTTKTGGSFWEAGLNWQPSARDQVKLGYGRRFFGKTSNISWAHKNRRLSFDFLYEEKLATKSTNLLSSQQQISSNTQSGANNSSAVFIEKRGQAGVSLNISKIKLNLTYTDMDRNYFNNSSSERIQQTNMRFNWKVASNISAQFDTFWYKYFRTSDGTKNIDTRYNLSLKRQISKRVSANIGYSFFGRNTVTDSSSYGVNTLSLGITANFK